jgi:hypothetical protein
MKKSLFTIGTNKSFSGYDTNDSWNGWKCPLFTLARAKKVIEHLNSQQLQYGGEVYDLFFYDELNDGIVTRSYEDKNIVNQSFDQAIIIKGKKYYDIGNYNYTWELLNNLT